VEPSQDVLGTGMIQCNSQGEAGLLVGSLGETNLSAATLLGCRERHRRRIPIARLRIVRIFDNDVPCQCFRHSEEALPIILSRLCAPGVNGLDYQIQSLLVPERVGVIVI
jgi:hypothetical protein